MPNTPSRATVQRVYGPPAKGALKRPCPDCQAPIGVACYVMRKDSDGNPYVGGSRAKPHQARKNPDPQPGRG